MKEEMTLKQFIHEVVKTQPTVKGLGLGIKLAEKLMEIEHIENWLNMMYGVELDIKVRPVEKKESRWLGIGVIDKLFD